MFQISTLSKKSGVSSKTIRYYEEVGLIPRAKRAENGYRMYDDPDVERLIFIRRARALNFALDEIIEILAFRDREEPPCRYVMDVMDERIDEIEERIRDLRRVSNDLKVLVEAGQHLSEDVLMRECVCHLIQETNVEGKPGHDFKIR